MTMSVDDGFGVLLPKLQRSSAELLAGRIHTEEIERKLQSAFKVVSFFGTGSNENGTGVRDYSDSDYFVWISHDDKYAKSDRLLEVLRERLLERYPRTAVAVRTPAVAVPFSGAASERYEITPAYLDEKRGNDYILRIPAPGGGWMLSSPAIHNRWVTDIDKRFGGKLKKLIQLIKAIAYYNEIPIKSFYIELRVTQIMKNEPSIVYRYDIVTCLRYLVSDELAAFRDPMGVSGLVAAGTEAQRELALSRLTTAFNRARKAREYEDNGKLADAFSEWDKVFDFNFPAYR